jgi:hypothetical protein
MPRPIDHIKRHFNSQGIKSITVPEWLTEDEKPLVIYYEPLTVKGKDALARLNKQYGDTLEWLVMVLIKHAKDNQGQPLFTLEDKKDFMHHADVRVIERVTSAILLDGGSYESEKKN